MPVIAQLVQADEDTVRDVIHRFNEIGLARLDPQWAGGRPRQLNADDENFVVATATTRPTKLGQPFTRWSIRKLCAYLRKVHGRVIRIGREALRCLLAGRGITSLRTPHIQMVKGSTGIPEHDYTSACTVNGVTVQGFAEPASIHRLVASGATLLLRNVEHWHCPTDELVRRMENDLGHPVEAFLFLTPPKAQGLPVHRDDADVLLLQIVRSVSRDSCCYCSLRASASRAGMAWEVTTGAVLVDHGLPDAL